jgi:hypothetical protein
MRLGSTIAKRVAATLEALRAEHPQLPARDDAPDVLPPVLACITRHVTGTALVMCYGVTPARHGDATPGRAPAGTTRDNQHLACMGAAYRHSRGRAA